MVISRSTYAAHALVIDAYTLGIGVSLHPATRGGTFGWRHTAYIYASEPDDRVSRSRHWTYFRTPLPPRPPAAVAFTTAGLGLGINSCHVGLQAGLETFFGTRLPLESSAALCLRYQPECPVDTSVEFLEPAKAKYD